MRTPAPAFPPALLHPRHWLSWLGVVCLAVLAFMPWSVRRWLGERIGSLMYRHNRKRRQIVLSNLQQCFPHLSPAERDSWTRQHLTEYTCALLDYSILLFRSRTWLLRRIHIEGLEQVDAAWRANENIMLLLGHSVWLEMAPIAIGQRYPAYGSYKPFKNQVLNWIITGNRLKDVEFAITREEGMMKLVRSLQPGRCLFFLPDQDHGEKHSVFAPFFGIPKATLTTPARIARLGKARAFPVMAFFCKTTGQYRVVIGKQLENFGQLSAEQDAANLNLGFQNLIEQNPVQYMWMLKLLRTRPPGSERIY